MSMKIPLDVVLAISEALDAGLALAEEAHALNMDAGEYDKETHLAVFVAESAVIKFRVYVLDRLPAIEMEAA